MDLNVGGSDSFGGAEAHSELGAEGHRRIEVKCARRDINDMPATELIQSSCVSKP